MEIKQQKGKTKHTFTFEDEFFNFAYEDKSGTGDTDIYYGDLPKKTSTQIQQNEWLRNVGFLWLAIGAFQSIYGSFIKSGLHIDPLWLLIGSACIIWATATKITYTILTTEKANVFIIQDKHHDQIFEKLMNGRKQQLLNWYGEVNPENELQTEIEKFEWLGKQEILSTQEVKDKIEQAKLFHQPVDNSLSEHVLN